MIEFFERNASRFYRFRLVLFTTAIVIVGVCVGTIMEMQVDSLSFRLAWAVFPLGFIPWFLALLAYWFDPDRGVLRMDSHWLSWLPPRGRSMLRGFSALVLAGAFVMVAVFVVAFPLLAISVGASRQ